MSGEGVHARLASSVLLLRDGLDGLELFMVVRHRQIEFASGALVFPGGSLDPDDDTIASLPERLGNTNDLNAAELALRVAAVRETFEECGILLARPEGSDEIVDAQKLLSIDSAFRASLCAGGISFSDMIKRENLTLALDQLAPFAHWITPVNVSKRFDTHFFLANAPLDQLAVHDGEETVDSIWITPRGAIDGSASGRYTVLFPTMRILIKLSQFTSAADVISAARRNAVITVMPEMTAREGGHRLRIPADAGYDGEVFDV